MKIKIKSFFATIIFYSCIAVICFLAYKWIYFLFEYDQDYTLTIIFSFAKGMLFIAFLYVITMSIASYKDIFFSFLLFFKMINIDYKHLDFDDLRIMVEVDKIELTFDNKPIVVLLSSIFNIVGFIFVYFISAFFLDVILGNSSYIFILLIWTLFFTGYFYVNYYQFFYIRSREIYIYLLLLALYILALLIQNKVFYELIFYYRPFDDYSKNIDIQHILYDYAVKYSGYLTDWALIL